MNISNENTMQLRPHQNEALAKMRLQRKGQVIVPTGGGKTMCMICLLYTSPSPRDRTRSRMPSSA